MLNKGLSDYGITPEQYVVISKLAEEEGISQKQLAQKLDKDVNTVKAILDKLMQHNYVLRQRNQDDKRAFALYLTESAREKLPCLRQVDEDCMQIVYGSLQEEQLNKLASELRQLRKNINHELKKRHER